MMTACIVFPGCKNREGYGIQRYKGKQMRAHRIAYALANGVHPHKLASDEIVLHSCDNPSCVNPAHLSLGTQQDNVDDMIAKGRKAPTHGEFSGTAVLTALAVAAIRSRYKARCSVNGVRALSREFSVSPMTISKVVNGLTW